MKTKFEFYLSPEEDGGGGDDPTDLLVDGVAPTEPVVETPVPVTPAFDPAALSSAFAGALREAGFTPTAQQQQKQLTPEEAKKLLNVWEPDDEFLQKFDNLDTRKASIAQMRDFFIKQADTINQLRLQEFQQRYEERYAPLEQYVSEQQAAARETRFNSAFPELAKPELKPLLASVVQGLAAQKALDPRDEGKSFKTIATAMEAVIKQANPNFKLSTATPTVKTNGNALKPTTGGSGGGGGGKGGADTSGKPKALAYL